MIPGECSFEWAVGMAQCSPYCAAGGDGQSSSRIWDGGVPLTLFFGALPTKTASKGLQIKQAW